MPPGPWAMSVMMQKLHPSATSGANSVMSPAGVMRAILAGAAVNSVPSVNQRLPSEPFVMARGWLLAVGTLNCFSPPMGAATAALPSDRAKPAASTVASARASRLDMIPPHDLTACLQRHSYEVRGTRRTVCARKRESREAMREGPAAQFGASAPAREAEFAAAVKAWVRARGMAPTVGERTGCVRRGRLDPEGEGGDRQRHRQRPDLGERVREVGQAR